MFIEVSEFSRRLNENVSNFKDQLERNKFCATDYHFVDHTADKNHFLTSRRFFDIVASTVVNALPVDALNGIDCYRLTSKGLEAVEVKLVELHTRGVFKSDKGALYYGKEPTTDSNKRNGLRSTFRASFEIYNNITSKNVPTVLVLFDTENNCVVDAIEMSGEQVIHYLSNVMDGNGAVLKTKTSRKRTIALSGFLKYGKKVSTVVPCVGFEAWEEELRKKEMPIISYK